MSAFDDFSHRGEPAGVILALMLHQAAPFVPVDVPIIEFVSRVCRHLERGTKYQIVVLAMRAAMERTNTRGHGNKAARREAQAFAARCHEEANPITAADVQRMAEADAERHAEGRIRRYHELPVAQPYE